MLKSTRMVIVVVNFTVMSNV